MSNDSYYIKISVWTSVIPFIGQSLAKKTVLKWNNWKVHLKHFLSHFHCISLVLWKSFSWIVNDAGKLLKLGNNPIFCSSRSQLVQKAMQTYLNLSKHIDTYPILSKQSKPFSNLYIPNQPIKSIHSNILTPTKTFPNLSKNMQTFL